MCLGNYIIVYDTKFGRLAGILPPIPPQISFWPGYNPPRNQVRQTQTSPQLQTKFASLAPSKPPQSVASRQLTEKRAIARPMNSPSGPSRPRPLPKPPLLYLAPPALNMEVSSRRPGDAIIGQTLLLASVPSAQASPSPASSHQLPAGVMMRGTALWISSGSGAWPPPCHAHLHSHSPHWDVNPNNPAVPLDWRHAPQLEEPPALHAAVRHWMFQTENYFQTCSIGNCSTCSYRGRGTQIDEAGMPGHIAPFRPSSPLAHAARGGEKAPGIDVLVATPRPSRPIWTE